MSAPEAGLAARSALAGHPLGQRWRGNGVTLAEISVPAILSICASPARAQEALLRTAELLGVEPPEHRRLAVHTDGCLVPIGPGRHLLIGRSTIAGSRLAALREGLANIAAVVDVSDHFTVIGVDGRLADGLLARFSSVDFAPHAFPIRSAVVTRGKDVRIIVWKEDDPRSFRIGVQRSLALGLWDSLIDCGRGMGAGTA